VHLDKRVTPTRINSTDTGNVPFPIYEDPLRQSIAGDRKAVYDPLGNHILWQSSPQSNPPPFYPRSSASFGSLGSSFGNAQESICELDGIPTNCDFAMQNKNIAKVTVISNMGARGIALELGLTLTKEFYWDGPELSEGLFWRFFHNSRNTRNFNHANPQKTSPAPQPNKLPDCVRKFLSQIGAFDQVVDAITYSTDGVPWYVPMDARAFVLGDHIYFKKGEFDPSNGISDAEMILLGHEARHVNQYRWRGKKTMAASYLWESAKQGLAGYYLGGTALAFDLSYWGNEYEADARNLEEGVANHIRIFGNPCK
jgi:hypothetical protein